MNRNSCPEQESLQEFLLGKIPAEQAELLEEHLLHCERCSTAADTISASDTLTSAIQPPDVYQDDDDDLVQAIEQAKKLHPPAEIVEQGNSAVDELHAQTTNAPDAAGGIIEPGKVFGRYRIQKELGAGAMGKVLLAEDTMLGRLVALKIPRFSGSVQQETLDRFLREARAAATIDHPNICPIYDIGELDGVHYISMAFIEGRPLSAYISESKLLNQRVVAMLVRKLARALAAAHAKGIIHRDLKPDNIMIKQSNEPVVMDFGLAFNQETRIESRMTQEGMLLGSPAYMSVEQVEGRIGDVGPQSDVYSLGVILFELLTGKIPFDGSVTAVLGQILTQAPPAPRQFRNDIDPVLESICQKMMAKSADDRYLSMEDVAQELTEFLREGSTSTSAGETSSAVASANSDENFDAAGNQRVKKLEQQKRQIETLLEKSEFATAIESLKMMSSIQGSELAKYAKWAQQQLPKARRAAQDLRGSSAAMYRTAAELCDHHDYEGAVEILQQIPQEFRDMKIKELLQECVELLEEVEALQANIDRADALNKYEGIQPSVERLLEIQPNDRRAKRLLKELKTYGKGSGMRVGGRHDGRFDAAGNTFSPMKAALFVGIPLLLFGLVTWATVIYVRSGDQTVKIQIDDPSAQVSIDGEQIKITGIGDTIKLKLGMHDLIVTRGDTVVHTRNFQVVRGKNPVLQISVSDADPVLGGAAVTTSSTLPQSQNFALEFDGTGTSAQLPIKLDLSQAFTIEGYFKRSSLDKSIAAAIDAGSIAQLRHAGFNWVALLRSAPAGPQSYAIASGKQLVSTNRFHAAFVHDGQSIALFLDGRQIGKTAVSPSTFDRRCDQIVIGGPGKGTLSAYTGLADEIRISNVARYDKGFTPAKRFEPDKSTLALYHLDEGEGDVLRDASGNGHHGKLTGATWVKTEVAPGPDHSVPDASSPNENSGQFVKLHEWPGEGCSDLAFSPDGKQGISVRSQVTFVWDLATGDVVKAMRGATPYLYSMDISPDGRRVVAGFRRGEGVAVFDTANEQILHYFKGHAKVDPVDVDDLKITSVAVSRDSKKALSVGGDGTIRLWEIETAKELLKLENQGGVVRFLPDGRFLSAWKDKVHIWDPETGEETQTIDGHNSQINSIAVSHDGNSLVVGLTGREILVRQLETQRVIQRISAVETADVAISNDGTRLLSCGNDRVVLWDLGTGKELGSAEQAKVAGVAISPDGTKALSNGKSDSNTILWRLP